LSFLFLEFGFWRKMNAEDMVRSIPLAIGLLMDCANTPIPVQMLGVVCCIIQKFGARMDNFPCVGSPRVVGLGCECSSLLCFLLRPLDSLVPCLTLRHWKLTAGLRPICSFFWGSTFGTNET
jgi:hypothetical protein